MVSVAPEGLRHDLVELRLDGINGLAGRESGAVGDAKDMRVNGESLFAERGVEHDIGGFAANAGKRLQFLARLRHFAAMLVDQRPR